MHSAVTATITYQVHRLEFPSEAEFSARLAKAAANSDGCRVGGSS
jgi:hypothetical protein